MSHVGEANFCTWCVVKTWRRLIFFLVASLTAWLCLGFIAVDSFILSVKLLPAVVDRGRLVGQLK